MNRPLVHRLRAEAVVEIERRCVPVEHGPLETAVATLDADIRKIREQPAPDAESAVGRPHEEVLEPEPGASRPGREVLKPEREPGRLPVVTRDHRLGRRTSAKE